MRIGLMSIFDKIRDRSSIISFIVKLQNTAVYPAIFAAICVISGTNGKDVYLPCIYILTAMAIFAGLFSSDLKVFLVPAFLIYCAIGMDVGEKYFCYSTPRPYFDLSAIPHFVICGVLLICVLVYRLIQSGAFKEMFKKRGMFFWSMIFMDAALLLAGAFSPSWRVENLLYGALAAFVLTLFYCMFLAIISRSQNGISYACKTLVALGFLVSAQVIVIMLRLHSFDNLIVANQSGIEHINRMMLSMSWGLPTIIGAVIALAIPASLYLARSHRFPVFYYFCAVFFWIMTVIIDTRSAILFGGLVLFAGIICCCISGKNRKTIRIVTLVLVVCVILIAVWLFFLNPQQGERVLEKLLDFLRLDFDDQTDTQAYSSIFGARAELWKRGIKDFLNAPLFGSGFMSGGVSAGEVYNKMYHNVFVEFLGSMGVFGLFAFLIHLKHGLEAIIRRFSLDKLLLLAVPMCILAMSLLDNFFFYPNFQIIYAAFLACAEISLERKRLDRLSNLNKPDKNERVRVAFTFIEAGKGHIVPTQTVCNEFKRKYGDKVEVIESKFFTETGDPDMEKTEKLFTRAVKNQNRSPILSMLCKIGNLLAGDSFALQVLLSQTVSGRKTAPLAVKHVEELDAHVVYTAHWATPYYINKMSTPRPYTICFCPDVYSNGVFNVDCNNFLISSEAGARQIERVRMYAGGNITRIPFPSRPEIAELRKDGMKTALRRELGIDENTFTVSLSDGGYGMARLGSTVEHIISRADMPITVIALCGTNEHLLGTLRQIADLKPNKNVTLIALGFTDKIAKYIAASDIYAGKSGANSISEPASLGVPVIVTKCITYIERGIKNYYVRDLKGAMYIPSAKRAAKKICEFAREPQLLEKYRKNLAKAPQELYDAEASADLIWQRMQELGYVE